VVEGRVVDEKGGYVEGAYVKIGSQVVYTTRNGEFAVSMNRNKRYKLTVAVEDFLTIGWRVVSAPAEVTPGEPVTIVVARKSANQ
jgi:hypothetical protein